jgi:hypothetical protein
VTSNHPTVPFTTMNININRKGKKKECGRSLILCINNKVIGKVKSEILKVKSEIIF